MTAKNTLIGVLKKRIIGFRVVITRNGKIRASFGNGHGYGSQVTKGIETKDVVTKQENWYHIVVTFEDYNHLKVYINGEIMDTGTISNASLTNISYRNEDPEIAADDYDTGERYW